jgi:hypothetical protein
MANIFEPGWSLGGAVTGGLRVEKREMSDRGMNNTKVQNNQQPPWRSDAGHGLKVDETSHFSAMTPQCANVFLAGSYGTMESHN